MVKYQRMRLKYIRLPTDDCLSSYRQRTSLLECIHAKAETEVADWSTYASEMSNWRKMSVVAGRSIKRTYALDERGRSAS